jgi:hypothetical protein
MILKISNRNKVLSTELKENQMILQRLSLLREETPKDQWGDELPSIEIDKHFTKVKVGYNKMFPPVPKWVFF